MQASKFANTFTNFNTDPSPFPLHRAKTWVPEIAFPYLNDDCGTIQ